MIRKRINIQTQIDAVNQAAAQALQSAQSAVSVSQGQTTTRPKGRPIFLVDFANSRFLDPRFTFLRNSVGTYVDRFGSIKTAQINKPRFEHDPITGESLGILYEPLVQNLFTYSNNFADVSWTKADHDIDVSTEVSPDGTNFATKLIDNSNNTEGVLKKSVTILANTNYTVSIFAKADTTGAEFKIGVSSNGSGAQAVFDLFTGTKTYGNTFGTTFTHVDSKIKKYKNGWYRCSLTYSTTQTSVSHGIFLKSGIHTGNGSYCHIWGAQLEKDIKASSYFENQATILTREQDYILVNGTTFQQVFGKIQRGTIFVCAKTGEPNPAYGINGKYCLFQGPLTTNGNNRIGVLYTTDNRTQGYIVKDGTTIYEYPTTIAPNTEVRLTLAFDTGFARSFVNGTGKTVSNNAVIPNLTEFRIGSDTSPCTTIKQIAFWNEVLSDAEMTALTTVGLSGKDGNQIPSVSDLGGNAFIRPESILRSNSRQHFTIDGTGASITRNIRFNFDFDFEIVDSSGCAITSQPSASCLANTDNALVFSAPLVKSLTYAVTPKFEY
ncbi:phage head spike fiber domain-containing protein [Flectobacillus rivi]|uniref:CBM-cenC domain-containing protein n=1 Tax=Flectobacillus rivi TaxID=2984209 RepID=A0ABT6Z0T5_9BACT|nr:hypothetical protein [Flectobacillus rivi]MDI9874645.1 hypothetical protein [Flectobacillus rivi]